MKKISNDEFNFAYSNEDNIRIINFVKSRYKKNIPKDELTNCGMLALWKSLAAYDITKRVKFTSFLYNMVKWECYKWVLEQEREKMKTAQSLKNAKYEHQFYDEFQDYLSILPKDLAEIIENRVLYNMSVAKISQEINLGPDAVRSKIDKAYRILRKYANRIILK